MPDNAKHKGFGIIHLNARSLLRNLDEIQKQFSNYDIIAITETWLTKQVDDRLLTFPNHSLIRQDR